MTQPTNPSFDIAHLAHVEMYTDKFKESLDFFTRVYGLKLSALDGDSAYLRAWDDYEFHSLKLTRHHQTGVGHIGYRAASPEVRERRVQIIEDSGYKTHGWVDGDLGHGRAFRFEDPFGHVFEIYYETRRAEPTEGDTPALKNTASRFTGAPPRRLDHLNLLSDDVAEFKRFMETCLGSRVTEMIQLDNGRIGGCWFTVNIRPMIWPAPRNMAVAWVVCTMSPMPPISARISCAPPISFWKTASISKPDRISMPYRARSFCMCGSLPETGWNWPMQARA